MRNFLLFLLYFLIVVPAALITRIVRDPLSREWDPAAKTYWIPSTESRS